MKRQMLAMFLIFIMVASAFGAIGLSATKVSALSETTKNTLSSTNYSPTPGQQYTISGLLSDSAGNGLAFKPIQIWYQTFDYYSTWQFSNTIYTGADGKYSTTVSSSQSVELKTVFQGDSGYASSTSNIVTINVGKTTVTLTSTNYAPAPGQQYTISGYLRDSAGNGLAYEPIMIEYRYTGQNTVPIVSNIVYTDANGKYSTTTSSSRSVDLMANFNGAYPWMNSWTDLVTINVGATTLSLTSTNYAPAPGQQYTISGYLRTGDGSGLANKPIGIWYHYPNEGWHFSNYVYTGTDGKYSTTVTSSQTVYLQTGFPGDTVYTSSSSNVVTINVLPPTLSLSSSNLYPGPGQQYTLSGRLTDSAGNPLAYQPINVFYHYEGAGWQYSNTIYTGPDGKYSTVTSSSQKVYLQTGYKVGSTYLASSNVVTITVH